MSERVETERERSLREWEERMERRTARHTTDRLPVQHVGQHSGFWRAMLHGTRNRVTTVPRVVAEAAWEGYDADGHGQNQDCKKIHQRGGFGLSELGYYLARAVDEGRVRIEIVRSSTEHGEAVLPASDSGSAPPPGRSVGD